MLPFSALWTHKCQTCWSLGIWGSQTFRDFLEPKLSIPCLARHVIDTALENGPTITGCCMPLHSWEHGVKPSNCGHRTKNEKYTLKVPWLAAIDPGTNTVWRVVGFAHIQYHIRKLTSQLVLEGSLGLQSVCTYTSFSANLYGKTWKHVWLSKPAWASSPNTLLQHFNQGASPPLPDLERCLLAVRPWKCSSSTMTWSYIP